MTKEEELDQTLTDLGTAATEGFASIATAVSDAADRVVKALEAADVDLTDEIKSVKGIKDAVSTSAAEATTLLAQIAPENVPTPAPVAEPVAESTDETDE